MTTVLEYAEALAQPVSVLIVEDSPDIALVLKQELRTYDTSVTHFTSAEEALEALEHAVFDIAFVDLMLPGANGVAVVRALKENKTSAPKTAIVLMTGYLDSSLIDEALGYGVAALMRKPEDFTHHRIEEIFGLFKLRARATPVVPVVKVATVGSQPV